MVQPFRILVVLLIALLLSTISLARSSSSTTTKSKREGGVAESPRAQRHMSRLRHSRVARRHARARRHRYYEHFYTSSFATDMTDGDNVAGEDPVVRQAAIDALGNMNGTVVAIDPTSGRILAMVNQKLALSEGAQPCSTIKL